MIDVPNGRASDRLQDAIHAPQGLPPRVTFLMNFAVELAELRRRLDEGDSTFAERAPDFTCSETSVDVLDALAMDAWWAAGAELLRGPAVWPASADDPNRHDVTPRDAAA